MCPSVLIFQNLRCFRPFLCHKYCNKLNVSIDSQRSCMLCALCSSMVECESGSSTVDDSCEDSLSSSHLDSSVDSVLSSSPSHVTHADVEVCHICYFLLINLLPLVTAYRLCEEGNKIISVCLSIHPLQLLIYRTFDIDFSVSVSHDHNLLEIEN